MHPCVTVLCSVKQLILLSSHNEHDILYRPTLVFRYQMFFYEIRMGSLAVELPNTKIKYVTSVIIFINNKSTKFCKMTWHIEIFIDKIKVGSLLSASRCKCQ